MHTPKRLNFKRRKVIVSGIDDTWQIDLVDVSAIKKFNNGFCFILTCIDVFSKFAWAIPLKSKNAKNTLEAFQSIILNGKRIPKKIHCDKGSEFINKDFGSYLIEKKIKLYNTNSELKASIVERFNRTLKEKMWRFFTKTGENKWLDVLSSLVNSYNNSYHRSIKINPIDVNRNNENKIFQSLYGFSKENGEINAIKIKFKKDDKIRISKSKRVFEKGYTPNWSEEIFVIKSVIPSLPPTYKIVDLNNENILGSFYDYEIQKVEKIDEIFNIQNILKKRKKDNKIEYFVSWKGYPKSFNSWVTQESIVLK